MSIAIVGAGVSGLALGLQLQREGIACQLYEARERAGGRVLTCAGRDLGPTWFWPDQNPLLTQAVAEFDLEHFAQWEEGTSLYQTRAGHLPQRFQHPTGYQGARRLRHGMGQLVEAMTARIKTPIHFEYRLGKVSKTSHGVELEFEMGSGQTHVSVHANQVVLCVPPRLLAQQVDFAPGLSFELSQVMNRTPTWMAGHAKAIVDYGTAFWRAQGLSGACFSHYPGAIAREIFDCCNPDASQPALGAFLAVNPADRQTWRSALEPLLLEQFACLFGGEAVSAQAYVIKDWFDDAFTSTPADAEILNSHPHYGHPWLQLDHWQDRLHFCGSETASVCGGYLEGALQSAMRVAQTLKLTHSVRHSA